MISPTKRLELSTRRAIIRHLLVLGLSQQDIATAMGLDLGAIRNDVNHLGSIQVRFDTTNLNWSERRDRAFNCAIREWFRIDFVSDYAKRLDVDQDVAKGITEALAVYLDTKRLNGIADGIMTLINSMVCPIDPPEYAPYRNLLNATFGSHFFGEPPAAAKGCLSKLWYPIDDESILLTRESFASKFAARVFADHREILGLPLNESIAIAVEEVLNTLPDEKIRHILRLRFGLTDGKVYTLAEIGTIYDVTQERIRQLEARGFRQFRNPERSRKLHLFLESPFVFTERTLRDMFPSPQPPVIEPGNAVVEDTLSIASKSIEELDMSVRSFNALWHNEVRTIGDLAQKKYNFGPNGIFRVKRLGRKGANELRGILESVGLSFGMTLENGVLKPPAASENQQ